MLIGYEVNTMLKLNTHFLCLRLMYSAAQTHWVILSSNTLRYLVQDQCIRLQKKTLGYPVQ